METEKIKTTYNKARHLRRLERQFLVQVWFQREDMDMFRQAAKKQDMTLSGFIRDAALKAARQIMANLEQNTHHVN